MKLIFREGRTKAIGSISKLIPFVPVQATGNRIKTKLFKKVDRLQGNKHSDINSDANQVNIKQSNVTTTTTATEGADLSNEQSSTMDINTS